MKKALVLTISILFTNCTGVPYYGEPEFDWMPQPLLWEQNVRDCRAQLQCNAADLFRRV